MKLLRNLLKWRKINSSFLISIIPVIRRKHAPIIIHIVEVSITNNDDTSSYNICDINIQGSNARLYIGEPNASENCKPFNGSIYTVSPIILNGEKTYENSEKEILDVMLKTDGGKFINL